MTSANRSIESIRAVWRHSEFKRGIIDTLSVNIGVGAWGLVTGVAMVQTGLPWPLAIAMSLLVYAGSAQLAAVPLIAASAPMWLVLAAAACVNLRFVVFSAQWRPFLMRYALRRRLMMGYVAGDATYVYFMSRFPDVPVDADSRAAQQAYFWGTAMTGWCSWQVATVAGVLLADSIPPQWGLAFAGVLALLALLYSLVTDGTSALAATVAGVTAIAAFTLPLHLHLVVAIVAGVAVGLLVERHGLRALPRKT